MQKFDKVFKTIGTNRISQSTYIVDKKSKVFFKDDFIFLNWIPSSYNNLRKLKEHCKLVENIIIYED